MDSSSLSSGGKSNKIRDIVRLQQLLKKWKKVAHNNKNINRISSGTPSTGGNNGGGTTTTNNNNAGSKSINKFLKKTLSFSESSSSFSSSSSSHMAAVPKGYVAVSVGNEEKRFVIRTEYLSHQVFGVLLREAEEEFGFQQEGVLKFPCEVDMFEKILKMLEDKRSSSSSGGRGDEEDFNMNMITISTSCAANNNNNNNCSSPDSSTTTSSSDLTPAAAHHHHIQMCR